MNIFFNKNKEKNKKIRVLFWVFFIAAVLIFFYLIFLPFWPAVQYKIYQKKTSEVDWSDLEAVKEQVELAKQKTDRGLPASEENTSSEVNSDLESGGNKADDFLPDPKADRIIIPKIGVNAPLVVSENYEYALNRGSWLDPKGARPGSIGNTIITGHRFKYFPPNNLTFYSLDKMEAGDIFSIYWQGQDYYYKVADKKIVTSTDVSILDQTEEEILTVFTCDPIFSEKNRLVITAEPL